MITNHLLLQGDCLVEMTKIPDNSVDMVLCDLPYGTTACKWDTVIDLPSLWAAYKRICKPGAAIVLTASQPFTSVLTCSNLKDFKYQWVWDKVKPGTGLYAKKRPLAQHEDVVIFGATLYNPQMVGKKHRKEDKLDSNGACYGSARVARHHDNKGLGYPKTILTFSNADQTGRVHPTQKPVALMEYMVKTYTDPGMTVLDNCMGSGTTGVACMNLNRRFIGIEQDADYFKIALERIWQKIELGEEEV